MLHVVTYCCSVENESEDICVKMGSLAVAARGHSVLRLLRFRMVRASSQLPSERLHREAYTYIYIQKKQIYRLYRGKGS